MWCLSFMLRCFCIARPRSELQGAGTWFLSGKTGCPTVGLPLGARDLCPSSLCFLFQQTAFSSLTPLSVLIIYTIRHACTTDHCRVSRHNLSSRRSHRFCSA